MTPTFCCGFECGQLGVGQHWTAATGASVSTSTVRSGARSLRINPTAAAPTVFPGAAGSTTATVMRFYIQFATVPSADTLLAFQNATTSRCGLGYKSSDGKLYAAGYNGTASVVFSGTGVSVTTGIWYLIDLKIAQAGGTATVSVQVDHTAATDSVTTATASTNFGVGSTQTVSGDWFIDDVLVSLTSADYPLGDGYVNHFVPTSDGTHTATTTTIVKGTVAAPTGGGNVAGATDVFNWVNAVPLLGGATDNTRLVNQQTAGTTLYAEVKFGPAPGISTPTVGPRAVEVITADREASTATCDFTAKINDNGTEATIIARGVVAGVITDRYATKQFATAPTGGAWNANSSGNAAFNNLKARWGYASDATPDLYWRGIMVEAEFAPLASNIPKQIPMTMQPFLAQ